MTSDLLNRISHVLSMVCLHSTYKGCLVASLYILYISYMMEPTVLIIAIFTSYNQIFIFTNRQMKHLHYIFALLYRFGAVLMCGAALFRPPLSLSLQVLMMMMVLSLPLLMLFRMCVCCHRRRLRARAHAVQREARRSNRQRPTLRQPSQCQEGARE